MKRKPVATEAAYRMRRVPAELVSVGGAWAEILRLRARCTIPEITAAECAVLARLLEDLCR